MCTKIMSFLFILTSITCQLGFGCLGSFAQNQFRGKLSNDTFTIRIFGQPINLSPGLTVTLSFTDPEIARLDSSRPVFNALGATELITESNPGTNEVTVVWDGYITNNEAKIIAMLAPGTKAGATRIHVSKVQIAGGVDITDSIAYRIEGDSVYNFEVKDSVLLGNISLNEPQKLVAPGKAAISFSTEKPFNNVSVTLNGIPVELVKSNIGVALVNLPEHGGNIDLALKVVQGSFSETANIGELVVAPPANEGRKPFIYNAVADNRLLPTKLSINGRRFGVRRFGEENTTVEVVPPKQSISNIDLKSRRARGEFNSSCIPDGSYVNISTPAGTAVSKFVVVGNCSD